MKHTYIHSSGRFLLMSCIYHVELLGVFSLACYRKDAKEEISDIKFSPRNDLMAVGSHDNFIYVYACPQVPTSPDLSPVFRLKGHSSYITHLDWSTDAKLLRYIYMYISAYVCTYVYNTHYLFPGQLVAVMNYYIGTWTLANNIRILQSHQMLLGQLPPSPLDSTLWVRLS